MTRHQTPDQPAASMTAIDNSASEASAPGSHLHDAVTRAVRNYLETLDDQTTTGFYELVLSQVEAPLLREVMQHTRNNQTRASNMLGLNRGTLRKKLKQYQLLSD